MPGPAPGVLGDETPLAEDPHHLQIGVHLDAATDHCGIHGVVVGVHPHVVVALEPQRACQVFCVSGFGDLHRMWLWSRSG